MKQPSFFSCPPPRFLPVPMSICQETRRQADISLRAASHFFKATGILDWGRRPYWERHLRVFHWTSHLLPDICRNSPTMKEGFRSPFTVIVQLRNKSAWANYMTRQSWRFFWLALINRWGASEICLCQPKAAQENSGKLEQRTISPVATNSCIEAERQPHSEGQKGGKCDRKFFFGVQTIHPRWLTDETEGYKMDAFAALQ